MQELLFDSQAEVGGGLGAFNAYLPRALSPSGDDYFLSVSQRLYSRKSKLGRIPKSGTYVACTLGGGVGLSA